MFGINRFFLICFFILVFFCKTVFAVNCREKQKETKTELQKDFFLTHICKNQDASNITFLGGLHFGSSGKWSDMLFEGDLNQHFVFNRFQKLKKENANDRKNMERENKENKKKISYYKEWNIFWANGKAILTFTPRVRLRMYWESSFPVKTPSFMPRITMYWWSDKTDEHFKNQTKKNFSYFSLMFSHHSNGQAGEFYNKNGTVNIDNGNFSTDFLEFSRYAIRKIRFLSWWRTSLVWHPNITREGGLKDQYERMKVKLAARVFEEKKWDWSFKNNTSLSYTAMGRKYIVAPNPPIKEKKARWHDNINFSMEFIIKTPWFDEFDLFAKYDYGYDYYNIHFQEKINRVQFGISSSFD